MTGIQRRDVWAAAVCIAALATSAGAQDLKTAALAKELRALMDASKADTIAAADPADGDRFIAAMYLPGMQLMLVSAKYSAPPLLVERLKKKEYRDVYVDLNSASIPASKVFITDLGIDGLRPKRDGSDPLDTYEAGGVSLSFDGDWKRQKLSEQDYLKRFGEAEDIYAKALTLLLAAMKRAS